MDILIICIQEKTRIAEQKEIEICAEKARLPVMRLETAEANTSVNDDLLVAEPSLNLAREAINQIPMVSTFTPKIFLVRNHQYHPDLCVDALRALVCRQQDSSALCT